MKPKINILENGVPTTREMTDAEYAEYMALMSAAEESKEE